MRRQPTSKSYLARCIIDNTNVGDIIQFMFRGQLTYGTIVTRRAGKAGTTLLVKTETGEETILSTKDIHEQLGKIVFCGKEATMTHEQIVSALQNSKVFTNENSSVGIDEKTHERLKSLLPKAAQVPALSPEENRLKIAFETIDKAFLALEQQQQQQQQAPLPPPPPPTSQQQVKEESMVFVGPVLSHKERQENKRLQQKLSPLEVLLEVTSLYEAGDFDAVIDVLANS